MLLGSEQAGNELADSSIPNDELAGHKLDVDEPADCSGLNYRMVNNKLDVDEPAGSEPAYYPPPNLLPAMLEHLAHIPRQLLVSP